MVEEVVSTMEQHVHASYGYAGYTRHHSYYIYKLYKGITAFQTLGNFEEGKISVESGSFIPGEYRTNPYSAKQTRVIVDHEGRGGITRASGDLLLGANTWPGIHPDFDPLIDDRDPVYVVTQDRVHTGNNVVKGYIPGVTYYNVRFIVGDWWRYRHAWSADDATPARDPSTYQQLALQKAKGKVGAADLEMGETIGEYRETIQMLKSPLSSLRKFLLDDNRRNFRLLRALLNGDNRTVAALTGRTGIASADAMASTWLELRYGLRPLVMLVQDVIDRVERGKRAMHDPDKIRSARSKLVFTDVNTDWHTTWYNGNPLIRTLVRVEDTYQATASVQYKQKLEQGFLDSLGLTPRFLPETAWQLTRLSFVWDWLFSIGPWLATLRINPGFEILGNTVGIKHTRKIKLVASEMQYAASQQTPWIPLSGVHDDSNGGDLTIEHNHYNREVDVTLSYLPHFTYGRVLDLFKAIDSVALIWQFAKKLK